VQNNRHDTDMYRHLVMGFGRYDIWLGDREWKQGDKKKQTFTNGTA